MFAVGIAGLIYGLGGVIGVTIPMLIQTLSAHTIVSYVHESGRFRAGMYASVVLTVFGVGSTLAGAVYVAMTQRIELALVVWIVGNSLLMTATSYVCMRTKRNPLL